MIAGARCNQQWIISTLGKANFRSNVRFDFVLLCGHVKARRSIDAMPIKESHGRDATLGTGGNERLGQGSAFQKTESRAGVEFDVLHGG